MWLVNDLPYMLYDMHVIISYHMELPIAYILVVIDQVLYLINDYQYILPSIDHVCPKVRSFIMSFFMHVQQEVVIS